MSETTPTATPITQTPATVQPKITGLNDIWYFGSITPAFYATSESLNATASNSSCYVWRIVEGFDHASFPGGVVDTTTCFNTIVLTANGKSTSEGDVGVTVRVNGVTSPVFRITIHSLDRIECREHRGLRLFRSRLRKPYKLRGDRSVQPCAALRYGY